MKRHLKWLRVRMSAAGWSEFEAPHPSWVLGDGDVVVGLTGLVGYVEHGTVFARPVLTLMCPRARWLYLWASQLLVRERFPDESVMEDAVRDDVAWRVSQSHIALSGFAAQLGIDPPPGLEAAERGGHLFGEVSWEHRGGGMVFHCLAKDYRERVGALAAALTSIAQLVLERVPTPEVARSLIRGSLEADGGREGDGDVLVLHQGSMLSMLDLGICFSLGDLIDWRSHGSPLWDRLSEPDRSVYSPGSLISRGMREAAMLLRERDLVAVMERVLQEVGVEGLPEMPDRRI